MKPAALITGGANGLGLCTGKYPAERGWTVFAADINQHALDNLPDPLIPIQMDVTDPESIAAGVETINQQADGLDGIVNCAGLLIVGSVIDVLEEDLQRILDVTLLGTYRVNKAFYPLLARRKGRIVNMSSETGWQTTAPFNGPYSICKHAIESYSDALRRELMFLGIKVIKVQPGGFKTDMVIGIETTFKNAIAESTYFRDMLTRHMQLAVAEVCKAGDPIIVARTIHKALTTSRPKAAYSVKPDPLRSFLNFLPTSIADAIIYHALKD